MNGLRSRVDLPCFRNSFPLGQHTAKRKLPSLGRLILLGIAVSIAVLGIAPAFSPSAQAAFPGRNGRIAFAAGQYVDPVGPAGTPGYGQYRDYDIFSISPTGSGLQQVTQGSFVDMLPAWSPDGRKIVFARADGDSLFEYDIHVVGADGGSPVNLTQSPQYRDWEPAWSPDGTKIVFRSDRASPEVATRPFFDLFRGDLFVMNADGGDLVQLTSGQGGESMPSWSPDGQWIAFRDMGANAIGLIKPDGTSRMTLVSTNGAYAPEWSPDGRQIVFERLAAGSTDVWVVDLKRSHAEGLTRDPALDLWPAWSPDGKYIAFVSDRDGTYRLYRMRADGSHVTSLVDIELPGDAPVDWGPRP